MIHLSVSRAFGPYKRGDVIVDPDKVRELLAGHNQHDVVQVISSPEIHSRDFFRGDDELAKKRAGKE